MIDPIFVNGKEVGRFIPDCAGFEIKTLALPTNWEYIYQNRDILLKLDQFGPVYVQAHPPGDVMLFKRENFQKFSSWTVWIEKDGKQPFNNFFRPQYSADNTSSEPNDLSIKFLPHCAAYSFEYDGLKVKTEFMIPKHGTEVCMKFSVKNTTDRKSKIKLTPFLVPYNNQAQLAPWDKNEWYLRSGYGNENSQTVFWSQLFSVDGDSEKRRTMIMFTDAENMTSAEISLEKFTGEGSNYIPEGIGRSELRLKGISGTGFGVCTDENSIYAYPPVYAQKYSFELDHDEEKTLTQVIAMPNNNADRWLPDIDDVIRSSKYFDNGIYEETKADVKAFFDGLFTKNSVKTGNELFDYYANYWIPLQTNWVSSLDRGWPTGMRGTRDAAQDYAALLYTDQKSCRNVLISMLECQRSDGWFPRQYSALGRTGTHDLRGHVDGGAFALEFFWMYLAHTGDYDVIDEEVVWLDSDCATTVLDHMIRGLEYYLAPENIGFHGLCKIREGDWLDSVNRAGVLGIGESVMVSCQTVMNLKYMADIFRKTDRHTDKISTYLTEAEKLTKAVLENAYNDMGFFNSVWSDGEEWLFSSEDPDGKERPYGPANYFAIISGIAPKSYYKSILSEMEKLKSEFGYRLYYPSLGEKPIMHVGRVASGDVPPYLAENGNVYNHGSQGFRARALAAVGDGDAMFETLQWMLPCFQDKHPTELAMTPPYAIVNCWQQNPVFTHRGLMCFLTGSVAMTTRCVYEWMMGVKPTLDGLSIDPVIPSSFEQASFSFDYRGKRVTLRISRTGNESISVNGKPITQKTDSPFSLRRVYLISPESLSENNIIEYTI